MKKVPEYVIIKPRESNPTAYHGYVTVGMIYKVTGVDRRQPTDHDVVMVEDDRGGISAVAVYDTIPVPFFAIPLARMLFSE